MSPFAALGQIVCGVSDSPSDGTGPAGDGMYTARRGGAACHAGGPGITPAALTTLGSSQLWFTITCSLGSPPRRGRTQLGTQGGLLTAAPRPPGSMAGSDCPQGHDRKAEGSLQAPSVSTCVCCFLTPDFQSFSGRNTNTATLAQKYFYCWSLGFLVSFSLNG